MAIFKTCKICKMCKNHREFFCTGRNRVHPIIVTQIRSMLDTSASTSSGVVLQEVHTRTRV